MASRSSVILGVALAMLRDGVYGLVVCGVDIPHARLSPASRALDGPRPAEFPYSAADLTPEWVRAVELVVCVRIHSLVPGATRPLTTSALTHHTRSHSPQALSLPRWAFSAPQQAGNDNLFYLMPKFVQHAGDECRDSLRRFYACVLPEDGDVLDLCSSFTSHYPSEWRGRRCAALGLNALELATNPSKTEWRVQDLNKQHKLPYDDSTFDVLTNSLSVDYLTSPIEIFTEMHRVLRPGGLACMAFTNRCFPTKVVPAWKRPFTEPAHAELVGNYFHFSAAWGQIGIADVSPDGWTGQRDPMIVVMARKADVDT